jgi:alanine racemase
MDLSMIDVGAVPRVEVGDEVVIIGRQGEEEVTLDELSAVAGVPVEHTLALLSARPSRIYTEGPGQAERTHSSADRA